MAERDIPKRVVVVLLAFVILVSFLGTLTVLQLYATAHRPYDLDASKATIGVGLLSPVESASTIKWSDDSSVVSIKISKYGG